MTTFSLVDLGLFIALVITSTVVLLVYFRLKALTRSLADHRAAFDATARSIDRAASAVQALNSESRPLVAALITRTTEANGVLASLTREGRRLELAKVMQFPGPHRFRDQNNAAAES